MMAAEKMGEGDERGQHSERGNLLQQAGRYSEVAFILPAATMVGWFAGTALDKHFHTDWIYIAGLLVGIVAGFWDLVRILMAEAK